MISAVIHGFILAFGLILPLGVQNVFIFNQGATQRKFSRTLPVVITASICDTILITLAVLGVSVIVLGVYWIKIVLLTGGIIFLVYMGYTTWKSKPATTSSSEKALTPKKQIVFAASVSLLNPHAIMDTIGVIGTSSISYSDTEKIGFTLACIITSWIWFFSLSLVGRQVGRLDNSGRFIIILNKVSALIMWGTAIYLIITLIS
ncbi:LysE/ArgO family amino acid transporter [Metabacillus fastidiosus]|uniref:LysE/ArgO family amino acid transporter n=1 Tax=Metabacillus fastidiosus TaxID=1458 RepID=UPI000825D84D|nr:LysE/ArgO family amino acid transporter [Metabacillus fastidiosus]MED4453007.1 LysE/ArgO family amino acid transporter [Metabacillus fastidiosus]MED4463059.1 LysE/ArgO family amino acid transporter [Metabacillus fastidiosus]